MAFFPKRFAYYSNSVAPMMVENVLDLILGSNRMYIYHTNANLINICVYEEVGTKLQKCFLSTFNSGLLHSVISYEIYYLFLLLCTYCGSPKTVTTPKVVSGVITSSNFVHSLVNFHAFSRNCAWMTVASSAVFRMRCAV